MRDGSHASVAVLRAQPEIAPGKRGEDLLIRMNNLYTLGGLGSLPDERRQAHLPLLLHPQPRSVLFLGMATGITAGAALNHPVERLVVAELVPDVVEAARRHFSPYVNGLFEDERVTVVVDDGRSFLLGEKGRFDVIVGDLFRPWAAGTGSLYTVEHFEAVGRRLADDGVFVQWLPLYQLSRLELGIIVRSLLEVFPQVTLWRGNFNSDKPTAALVAQKQEVPLSPETLLENAHNLNVNTDDPEVLIELLVQLRGEGLRDFDEAQRVFLARLLPQLLERTPFTFYAGNLSENRELFASYPLNTRNRPEIEYRALITLGHVRGAGDSWLTSGSALALYDELAKALPPGRDPYLRNLNASQREYVRAGLSYFKSTVYQRSGRAEEAQRWFGDYLSKMGLERGG